MAGQATRSASRVHAQQSEEKRRRGTAPSPNHRAKRDFIIAATVEVLLRDGVHACTARSIAAAAGVANGAVHYYFDDVDEIVDLAMRSATTKWIEWVRFRSGQGSQSDPAALFWAAVNASVEPFTRGDRTLMPLWLEYWAACTRAGRLGPLREVQGLLISYMTELLDACQTPDPADRALAVSCYLFGAGMQESIEAILPADLRRHVGALCAMPPPTVIGHASTKMGQLSKTVRRRTGNTR